MRLAYAAELEQLRLQVEVMAVRVDENLERMARVLATGDCRVAAEAVAADDDIDAMNVSLTERCYDVLRREQPMASDLRFVVSVIRVLGELERIGDLALRVVKLAPDQPRLASNAVTYDILLDMAEEAGDRFARALQGWATQDLGLATELAGSSSTMDSYYERLTTELFDLIGPDAVRVALTTLVAGRSLERIADHARIIGARLRYLITGDPDHLATEVR